jgi:hypothetical protein
VLNQGGFIALRDAVVNLVKLPLIRMTDFRGASRARDSRRAGQKHGSRRRLLTTKVHLFFTCLRNDTDAILLRASVAIASARMPKTTPIIIENVKCKYRRMLPYLLRF